MTTSACLQGAHLHLLVQHVQGLGGDRGVQAEDQGCQSEQEGGDSDGIPFFSLKNRLTSTAQKSHKFTSRGQSDSFEYSVSLFRYWDSLALDLTCHQ